MKKQHLIVLFAFAGLSYCPAYAQQSDSIKQTQINYVSKDLGLDVVKAEKVFAVMDEYKQNAKKAINDKTLKPEALKAKIDLLIDEKNKQLSLLLNEQQLQKIIPTTERPKDKIGKSTNH